MNRILEKFLDSYPDGPGWKEPGTSREAALSVADGLTENQAKVLIKASPERRTNDSGRRAVVWREA